MRYRRESRAIVQRKVRQGIYQSYSNGDRRMIVFASVKADRERLLAEGSRLTPYNPAFKLKRGRPPKNRAADNPQPAEARERVREDETA